MFGYRADGVRLKGTDAMYTVAAHIMVKRYDAMNMITVDIPLAPMRHYMNEVRNRTGEHISHATILMAAYLRVAAEFPEINRFVVNKKFYARNEFPIAMVVLKGSIQDHGTMSKVFLNPNDTIFDVNNKLNAYIEQNRKASEKNATDDLINTLLSIPGLLSIGVPVLKWMDKHGLLPKSIIDASPFHNSLVFTNLASIRTNHIYHHLYDFGTSSIFFAMGNLREVPVRKGKEVTFERCLPVGVVMDERICSGSYFALVMRRFSEYLADPSLLETPPESITLDPNIPEKKKKRFSAMLTPAPFVKPETPAEESAEAEPATV